MANNNILNQDEIDSLLGAMERGEVDKNAAGNVAAGGAAPVSSSAHRRRKIADYNFRRPNLITKDQLRNFQSIHETFAREMAASLALFLRSQVEFNLISTEQQQYMEFVAAMQEVTHTVVFSANPLPGLAVCEVNLSLIFGVVDMLLGGHGDTKSELRVPTDIEIAILNPFIDRIIENLQNAWHTLMEVTLKNERIESDPEYVQAAPADAPVVVLSFDTKIGHANGIINLCYPLPMIQQMNELLSQSAGTLDSYYGKRANEESRKQILDSLLRVPLPVSVKLGEAKIKGRDLLELAPGDVIMLDTELTDPLVVSVSGRPLFFARPGRIKDKLFARLGQRMIHHDEDDLPDLTLE